MICRSDEILKIIKEHPDTSDIGCGPTGKFNDLRKHIWAEIPDEQFKDIVHMF